MSQQVVDLTLFHKPLMDAGLVPPNCKVMHIAIGVNGALTITYEVFVDAVDLVELGLVFQAVGQAVLDGH